MSGRWGGAKRTLTPLIPANAGTQIKRLDRRIKEWRRSWKLSMIEEANPTWSDLYKTLNR